MSKTRDTGFLNNVIKTDSQGNVTIVSGSTNLLSISSSGAITTTGVISGSNALSASFALTASSADNFVVRQNVTASNVLSTGNITAQTLVVQTVTSSITYSSGSNIFGNQLTNVQQFTGSLRVTGSGNHFIQGANVGIGTTSPSNLLHLYGTDGLSYLRWTSDVATTGTRIGYNGTEFRIDQQQNADITLRTNGSERARITGGGNLQVTGSAFFSTTAAFAGRVTAGGSMLLGEVQSSYSLLETTAGNGIWLRPVGIASPGGLFVTTGGNVGIGTTTPDAIFHVAKSTSAGLGGQIVIDNPAGSAVGNAVEISFLTDAGASGAGTRNGRIRVVNENVNDGRANMQFWTWDGGADAERMRITSTGAVTFTSTITSDSITTRSNAGSSVSITTNGQSGATGSPLATELIFRGFNGNPNGRILVNDVSNSAQVGNMVFYTYNGGQVTCMTLTQAGAANFNSLGTGTVYSNGGTLTNTNPSDERLKENIGDLEWGLNEILQLRPVKYNWKEDKANQGKQYGFIAQEVQPIMPDLVKEFTIPANEELGTEEVVRLGLEKDGIYATLVKAIQELNTKLDEANAKIAALEEKIV